MVYFNMILVRLLHKAAKNSKAPLVKTMRGFELFAATPPIAFWGDPAVPSLTPRE